MPFSDGTRLDHYEILEEVGRGGMGVVYRARDTKLRRDVAIKVLPEALVKDRERLARFEREARVLAALSHPNVATIHDLGHSDDTHFLVMELVSGEDLSERLSRGPLSIGDALPLFRQIAEALEVAHENGIVHRDLKPANIKLTSDGRIKVLDFGLAKPVEAGQPEQGPELSQSPTVTRNRTTPGVILGTAAYMSPEQATGKVVDKRTDVWAFGCVMYEALTGRQAFSADTALETIATILGSEPDWDVLPETTPAAIRTLVRRCLRKEPKRRLHDIADARIVIEEAVEAPEETPARGFAKTSRLPWLVAALSGLALVVALVSAFRPADPAELMRLSIVAPDDTELLPLQPPAVSPDGSQVAFVAREESGATRLWVRPLDSLSSRALPGTEGGAHPFWSPDGQKLGFFANGGLMTIDLAGGELRRLADAELARGGTWSPDGTILFTPSRSAALFRVPAGGGPVEQVTTLGPRDFSHRHPQFLPDGRHFLYMRACAVKSPACKVGSIDPDEAHRLPPNRQ